MVPVAMYPPLFKKLMLPVRNEWDRKYGTPGELRLAAEVDHQSGSPGLRVAGA